LYSYSHSYSQFTHSHTHNLHAKNCCLFYANDRDFNASLAAFWHLSGGPGDGQVKAGYGYGYIHARYLYL